LKLIWAKKLSRFLSYQRSFEFQTCEDGLAA
jgi:hypothetical protein